MPPSALFPIADEDAVQDWQNSTSQADFYIEKVKSNIKRANDLCPLDSPEKTDQATPFWRGFYDVLSSTTLDIDTENAILRHPDILNLMPDIRNVMRETEVALEITWAERVVGARDSTHAWDIYTNSPIHAYYDQTLKFEWSALLLALGRNPTAVAILGSGAMPETGIYIKDWANKMGLQIKLYNLDLIPSRLELGKKVYAQLCGSDDCIFEAGDVTVTPKSLKEYDIVYFNASMGLTTAEKERILLDVVRRMKPGALILTRSTNSLKTMAYPAAQLSTPQVIERLRPVMTVHLNGEAGCSSNASFIISKVTK